MIGKIPFGYEYVEFIKTVAIPFKHLVVRVSSTPPDALKSLKEFDRAQFEYDGEHAIEFLED